MSPAKTVQPGDAPPTQTPNEDVRFAITPATREPTHLLIGIAGPSGAGKTFSALRLAKGIASVAGGEVTVIDTEHRRSKHYADAFSFRHMDLRPPFGSLDYLAALRAAAATQPAVIIVDSFSHEHDGEGGMLDAVNAELERMGGSDPVQQLRFSAAAWRRPRINRRALLSGILRLNTHVIICMRANERARLNRDAASADVAETGLAPIAAPELLYELGCCALLRANAPGAPVWRSAHPSEHLAIKLPKQFEEIIAGAEPLNEAHGAALAHWAVGSQFSKQQQRRPRSRVSKAGSRGNGQALLDKASPSSAAANGALSSC